MLFSGGARLCGVTSREEATALIADGFRVWPVRGKTPARAGFARANGPDVCADPAEFDAPRVEVAVLAGPCPAAGPGARYVCLDYDGPVPAWARVGGAPTLTSKRGAHAWYRVPADVHGFRQTAGVRRGLDQGLDGGDGRAWAVDTRDFGGYAVETKNGEPLWDEDGEAFPRDITQAEVDALFPPQATAAEPGAYTPPARRTVPSDASVASFVFRVVANPDGTNQCFGAVGACLAAWGWANEDIGAALDAWFAGAAAAGLPGRHRASALRAADTRRAGGQVPGFPKLAELGVVFVPEASTTEDVSALLLAEPPEERAAKAEDLWGFTSGRTVAAWVPPPIAWVSEELCLAPGAPGIITGYGGSGKTTFVQHLALCVVAGGRLLGQYAVRQGAVTHLDYEQGADLTMRRYLDLGLTDLPEEAQDRLRFRSFPTRKLTDADAYEALLRAADGQTLLIVDSLVASADLDDENAAAARAPLDVLGRVSDATGCAVLVVHHSKKDRSNGRTSARGSSAITDAVSVHVTYERDDEAGAGSPVTLKLEKIRHVMPARAWVDGVVVTRTSAGLLRVVDQTAAVASASSALATDVAVLFQSGWTGSASQLADEVNRRKTDVLAVVKQLTQDGIIQKKGFILSLTGSGL